MLPRNDAAKPGKTEQTLVGAPAETAPWLDGPAPDASASDRPPAERQDGAGSRSARGRKSGRASRGDSRPALIARIWATAERQVAEIDARLESAGGDPVTLERDAKTLSVLARTLRDLVALDEATRKKPERTHETSEIPRDVDAFRRALAEKLVELGKLERGD